MARVAPGVGGVGGRAAPQCPGIAVVVLVGVGTGVAYAVSEALKLVVDEERPCRAVRGVAAVADCPGAGDWSFPSIHATLAAALAVGLVVLRPRLAAVVLPLAAVVAVARVAAGVHYPHDVLAGAALGAAVVTAAVWSAAPPVARAAAVLLERRGRSGVALGDR
ncbi:phosphatase PAP2 family protein [Streptomyces sp. FXJ1.4098]|nr:phosphatase PAP2 family protein [Streptomyces sp. FXJ1.4098]